MVCSKSIISLLVLAALVSCDENVSLEENPPQISRVVRQSDDVVENEKAVQEAPMGSMPLKEHMLISRLKGQEEPDLLNETNDGVHGINRFKRSSKSFKKGGGVAKGGGGCKKGRK